MTFDDTAAGSVPDVTALLALLDDPDEDVGRHVSQALLERGAALAPMLREVARTSDDATARARALHVVHVHQQHALHALLQLLVHSRNTGIDVDLEEAMLALDRFGNPGRDLSTVRTTLDSIALDVHERFIAMQVANDLTQLLAINDVLYGTFGFTGATEPYYDPRNSYISDVIERHTGIPISLCAIQLLVADRSGLQLQPVALPVHFMLLCPPINVIVDAFQGGVFVEREECRAIVERNGIAFRDDMLEPVRNIDCIIRMMRNLAFAHAHVGDVWEATILHQTLEALQ